MKMKNVLTGILTVGLLAGLAVPAAAADSVNTVSYRAVDIVVNGDRIHPKDANGAPVEPFLYQGTTYLPVRSVANALGLDVGWEDGTVILTSNGSGKAAVGTPIYSNRDREVYMGGSEVKVTLDGKALELKDANGNTVTPIIVNGVTYLPVRAVADALNVKVEWDGSTNTVYLGKKILWLPTEIKYNSELVGGYVQTFTYDTKGNVLTNITKYSNYTDETRYAYDAQGNVTRYTYKSTDPDYPLSFEYVYTYDAKGNKLTEKFTQEQYPTESYTTTYTYDANGNLIRENLVYNDDSMAEMVYSYDAKNQLVKLVQSYKGETLYTTTYTYDNRGNTLTEYVVASDKSSETLTTNTYDSRNNLLSCVIKDVYRYDGQENTSITTETYTYDRDNNVLTAAYSDGTFSDKFTYTYDDRGNIIKDTYSDNENYTFTTVTTYDQYDNVTSTTATSSESPTEKVFWTYTYNDGGDILTETYTSDSGETDTYTYTYDSHGNLLTESSGSDYSYTYKYTSIQP